MSEMMDCEKYHARIPVQTCLARHREAAAAGVHAKWGSARASTDPGCRHCEQGAAVAAGASAEAPQETPAEMRAAGERAAGLKTCKKCGTTLPADRFPFCAGYKDNRDSVCMACRAARQAEYHLRAKARKAAKICRRPEPAADNHKEIPPADLIRIQRPDRDTIVLTIGVNCLEHIDVIVRPRKQPKAVKEDQP